MYSKLELPVVMARRGEVYDLDDALTDAYAGKWTTLTKPFSGEKVGARVQVTRFMNAGFRGQVVCLRNEAGRSLGCAPQEALDVDALLK